MPGPSVGGVLLASDPMYGGSRSLCTWATQTPLLEHSTKAWWCTTRLVFKWGGATGPPAHVLHVHTLCYWIFLRLPRTERNQRFLFVKKESIKVCCSGGSWHVPDVVEASVLFFCTVFHVRNVLCRCLYLAFRASCAPVTRVTRSKRLILGVPLETKYSCRISV